MGDAAGPGASIAGAGFQALATITAAEGKKAGADFKASELDRASEYGKIKADQTSATLTQRLNMTLGNIDAIRAAGHNDPTSPTGAAFREHEEMIGDRQRDITHTNILNQARQDAADAAYLRSAGKNALLAGYLSAGGQLLGGAGKTMSGGGGGVPFAPDDI